MTEIQMLLSMGYKSKPRHEGLAAPAIHQRSGLYVWDNELQGTVPVRKPCGEIVRDTRRAPFSKKI